MIWQTLKLGYMAFIIPYMLGMIYNVIVANGGQPVYLTWSVGFLTMASVFYIFHLYFYITRREELNKQVDEGLQE